MNKFWEQINIGSKFDAKGFKQAESALGRLSGSATKLAAGFGVAFGARAIGNFARDSVKAFAEDERASVKLLKAVDNLGMGFERTRISNFISDMEKSAMVSDDQLRPAMQALLTTTGSVTKSQDLLKLALDVSAGSGEDLATVSQDIAAAYVGQTKGLKKYNLGLTTAELSTAGFATIQEKLNTQFSGQNAARLDTYQGKLDTLNIAFGNMQETIGKGLLDSFGVLAGDAGIGGAASAMADFADFTSNAIYGLANLVSIKAPSGKTSLFGLLLAPIKDSLVAGPLGALSRLGARLQEQANLAKPIAKNATGTPLTIAKSDADVQRAKLEKEAAARAKALAAANKKGQKVQQDLLKLSKAKAIFDMQKIQIEAALKGNISKEERIRLLLMKAIANENISDIEKYTKLLTDVQNKVTDLQKLLEGLNKPLPDPFAGWTSIAGNTMEAIKQVSKEMFTIPTIIQESGREWSSFANLVNNTVLQPNLKEWNSPFSGGDNPFIPPNPNAGNGGNAGGSGGGNQALSITVNGALDPVAVANQIKKVLENSANQVGNNYGLGTGSKDVQYIV